MFDDMGIDCSNDRYINNYWYDTSNPISPFYTGDRRIDSIADPSDPFNEDILPQKQKDLAGYLMSDKFDQDCIYIGRALKYYATIIKGKLKYLFARMQKISYNFK